MAAAQLEVAEAVPQKVYLGCYYVNRHHYCWAADLKAVPAQRYYFPQRLEEALAALGVAPEAVTLSLPEQNLIQILSLSATAVVPGVQEGVQAAALPLVVVQADPGAVRGVAQ